VARAQFALLEQTPQPRADAWQVVVGVRNALIRSSGFDPFSENDHLPQFSMSASRALSKPAARGLGVAVGLGFDVGSSSSFARNADSDITLSRFLLLAEARYHLSPRLYGFGRLAPGASRGTARLREASSPAYAPLLDSFTTLAVDASAGAAFCVSGMSSRIGAWLLADVGYGWTPQHHLRLSPDLAERDSDKVAPLDLGTLAARGVLFRFSFALSY
jgi:hypothetical protein